jgi:hypothetical protein
MTIIHIWSQIEWLHNTKFLLMKNKVVEWIWVIQKIYHVQRFH